MRHRHGLGGRNNERIDYHRPGLLIREPDAAWVECFILDVSEAGVRLDVGALGAVPEIFGVAFNSDGKVIRLCQIAWRRDERIDALFLTPRQLRQRQRIYRDPRLQKLPAACGRPSSEERALARVSKDGPGLPWFETHSFTALLTMRRDTSSARGTSSS